MKIFLYHKNSIQIDQRFKLELMDCACRIFKIMRGNIISCELNRIESLKVGEKTFDYYCVVEDPTNDLSRYCESFNNELNTKLSKITGSYLMGNTLFTKEFDKKSFETLNIKNENTSYDGSDEYDYKARSLNYIPVDPSYSFDRVILDQDTLNAILEAINLLEYESKVFDEWGLRTIQPNPCSALSFFGPSGTGKTMAAEAVAEKLGKKILKASYADIESKYHGEGPKMVKAIFKAAQDNDAILFIDEADSLLSKRLTNVTQGSEQAINSMRSQLLICLEEFHGIVIFATNLVVNYDKAFLTRLVSIEFKKPNAEQREKIWNVHIYPVNSNGLKIPLGKDVSTKALAEKYEFTGREIRKAVISACVNAAMNNREVVSQSDFVAASEKILKENSALSSQS